MFDIRANVAQVNRQLSDIAQKQLPYALALSINDTLADVEKNNAKSMEKQLDRPTPFTQRGLYKVRATKRKLYGEVGFKDIQARYLEILVEGGSRRPKRKAIVIPVGQRLNKYGNMPKGAIPRAIRKSNVFSGKVKGVGGVWQRTRKGVKLLARYESRARYKKSFKFQQPAQKAAEQVLPRHLNKNLRKALASRR